MYHCHIHFYLAGCPYRFAKVIKEIPVPEHFTHTFSESSTPQKELAAEADVVLACIADMDVEEALGALLTDRRQDSQLILLANSSQIGQLSAALPHIWDIWTLPLSEEELSFRFLRWQSTYKMEKDFWETSHFLEATINHVPNLIWYKNREGLHEKVNECFCETVGKTKQQVEGRDHFYIWDVDPNDPANNAKIGRASCRERVSLR